MCTTRRTTLRSALVCELEEMMSRVDGWLKDEQADRLRALQWGKFFDKVGYGSFGGLR